ncbi:MAG TPA: hypothetical protein VNV86_01525, partial [Candidatus Acidoferrum sp.]|nr:hypothetical protein [Candidatus Acidoferrum sp.]
MFSRSILAGLLAAAALCAAPQPLTTIQDTLFKADGTRFNGTLTISWTNFEAIDHSQILQQTATVTVVDGNLRVQLVPTTTATPVAFYTVVYNSDGRVQFTETWAVPSSVQPLRVRDVRIVAPGAAGDTAGTTPVQETDVVGLISDLGARPLKGPAYAPGRVAWVNPTGALETVTGSPSDCVRVDGTSGPCGGTQPAFNDNETPAGLVDGANATFTLAAVPNPASSLVIYRNGVLQKVGQDYSLTANTITFLAGAAPQPGDTLLAGYRIPGASTDPNQLFASAQVMCSGLGAGTTSVTLASVGTCVIPGGLLAAGDRIQISFDLEHQGTAGGYSFEVHWGATTLLHRDAVVGDSLATGRADLALKSIGAQVSHQTWGTILSLTSGVGTANDDYFTNGIAIDFQARAST